jgi:hypothetical protein
MLGAAHVQGSWRSLAFFIRFLLAALCNRAPRLYPQGEGEYA